jgi:hypothetical protein
MTDGDVDVVLPVTGRRDGEQRGDRPALDDLEAIVHQAPFDVLRAAEMRFDAPAQLRELNDLRIRQHRLRLPLGGDRLRDDCAVPHLVHVGIHQTGDEGLTKAEAGLD